MLVSFGFPIADARPFAVGTALRLPFPDWPNPSTDINPQFVHYFGKACERVREPDAAWPDEIKYCRSRNGLRFDALEAHRVGRSGDSFSPSCAFRRLFCDGQAVVRVQVGLTCPRKRASLLRFEIADVLTIARQIAELPTLVPPLQTARTPRPMLAQGKHLARLYALASMNGSAHRSNSLRLVEAGDPMMLIELRPNQADFDGHHFSTRGLLRVKPECVNGAVALFCRLQTTAGIIPTWITQKGKGSVGQLRSLRICLSRLHVEREVLDLVLKQLTRGRLLSPPTEEAVNSLDAYFNDRLKLVNRASWAGIQQSVVLEAFDAAQAVVRPAMEAQLLNRYQGSRRQVWSKIQAFQENRRATKLVSVTSIEEGAIVVNKNVNVSGTGNIVNVAEYMANVTNTVNNNLAQSTEDEELKELVKKLNAQIEAIAPQAEPSQVKKLGKNLEALSREVASDEPDPKWYEVSLSGLKEAAQAVGTVAKPVLETVAALSKLLLP